MQLQFCSLYSSLLSHAIQLSQLWIFLIRKMNKLLYTVSEG